MNQFDIPFSRKKVSEKDGDLMTVAEFKDTCESGMFIDYDGMGDLVIDGFIVTEKDENGWPKWIKPSQRNNIPENITHILWYNR